MPFAPVNEDGAVMYYDDSGIPDDSATYTTVILVHGLVFHGGSYDILLKSVAVDVLHSDLPPNVPTCNVVELAPYRAEPAGLSKVHAIHSFGARRSLLSRL